MTSNAHALDRNLQALGQMTQHKRAAKKMAKNKEAIKGLLNDLKERPRFAKLVDCKYQTKCSRPVCGVFRERLDWSFL